MSADTVTETKASVELNPCWSCNGPVSVRAPFCHICGAIQPPRALDHFARLNLPVAFDLQQSDLDRQYFGLQRYFHPDRFAAKSRREQALSLQQSTSLNQAYEVLKRPLARAEYLLELNGHPVPGGDGQTTSDQGLLMEALEMRERLDEAADAAEVDALVAEVGGEIDQGFAAVGRAFDIADLPAAAKLVMRLRYLSRLLEEARGRRARLGV